MGVGLRALKLRSVVGAIVCGLLLSLATGFAENSPEVGIPEFKHYGYPLVWRVTKTFEPTEYRFTSFTIDAAFWIAISLLTLILLELLKSKVGFKYEMLLLPLVLFIPLGLVMDFVHESGHALWGTATGGRLTYMKVTYLEIYPRLALTPQFELGKVQVVWDGPGPTYFQYGLFLLGGSLMTNIVSWLLALILLWTRLGHKTQVALRLLGIFGLLDLPLYVLFPQIGLRHWIFLGGCQPEPLLGARMMEIPDVAFYVIVGLTTLGLIFLHFRPLWDKAEKRIRIFLGKAQSRHEDFHEPNNTPMTTVRVYHSIEGYCCGNHKLFLKGTISYTEPTQPGCIPP